MGDRIGRSGLTDPHANRDEPERHRAPADELDGQLPLFGQDEAAEQCTCGQLAMPEPDAQYGTLWRCPCGLTYASEDNRLVG